MRIALLFISLAIFFNTIRVLQARWLTKFSRAKLDIARLVTKMEKLLLARQFTMGDICHDVLYQDMIQSLHARRYGVKWAFWKDYKRTKEWRNKLHAEIEKNSEVSEIIRKYSRAEFCAFRSNRPLLALLFMVWLIMVASGMLAVLLGLITVTKAHQAWEKFKATAAEYYVVSASRTA
jgi:hypothetical protein